VVPTSILSPDADMVVERTTYKSKLYQMEQAKPVNCILKQKTKSNLRCLWSR